MKTLEQKIKELEEIKSKLRENYHEGESSKYIEAFIKIEQLILDYYKLDCKA